MKFDKLSSFLKTILVVFIFNIPLIISGQEKDLFSFSLGPVEIGQSRIPLKLKDFKIKIVSKNPKRIKARFIKKSVQWVRAKNNLLTPRVRVAIKVQGEKPRIHFQYLGKSFIPEKRKNYFYSEIFVSLFNPAEIKINNGKSELAQILITAEKVNRPTKETHLIDYSCAKYQLSIEGLEGQYLSVGCHLERRGKWGKERPRLEISWSSTNYRLLNGGGPPYVVILNGKSPAKFTVVDNEGNEKEVSFKAKLPKRLKRLKTALGFGPYLYRRSIDDVKKSNELAPAFFLYGNLYMTNSTSLRFFDGFVWRNPSYFNNFGFYFAYNLADAFDGRIELVPLLGIQGLSFKLLDNSKTFTQLIYPQGFELIYKHAFGIENYNIVYGMFISTSSEVGYNNLWIRWGKGYFWELNYIDWEKNGKKAAMYGLSIGVPFLSFF